MLRFTFLLLPVALCYYTSPPADSAPTVDLTSLFQHKASRNQRVISQAMEIVVAMQTSPTCSRMAASHLMNECKLLEHAPEFAKARPEAYLDNVKTEFAAKLAVCELLSAQPHNPSAPAHCGILVPSTSACARGGAWWYSRQEKTLPDKQCYPEYRDQQYAQCLKTLQSSPQYWTSFSNARQNAVVMCQASRDAVERENHLETFKNLTQVMGAVSETIKSSLEDYAATMHDQKMSMEEFQTTQERLKNDAQAVYEKAIANMGSLDTKFHNFMDQSMGQLVSALAADQNLEIGKLRQQLQGFSVDLATQSSDIVHQFNRQLRVQHELALSSLRANHEAQLDSYNVLSTHLDHIHNSAVRTSAAVNSSFDQITVIEKRLSSLSDQTDTIIEGLAIFSTWSNILLSLFRSCSIGLGLIAIVAAACKLNKRLAAYIILMSGAAILVYTVYKHSAMFTSREATIVSEGLSLILPTNSVLKLFRTLVMFAVCLAIACPVCYALLQLIFVTGSSCEKVLASYWLTPHSNQTGMGMLPSVEVPYFNPAPMSSRSLHVERGLVRDSAERKFAR